MTEYRSVLERAGSNAPQPDLQVERVLRRRDHKRRNQRIRAGVLGLALAIAVGWLGVNAIRSTPPVPGDEPTPSPSGTALRRDGEVISYSVEDPRAEGDLVAVDPATGQSRMLVDGEEIPGRIGNAAWSPDGRWLALDAAGGVWAVNAEGGLRQLAEGQGLGYGGWTWSPTGAQLAMIRGSTLTVLDASTGGQTDLGDVVGDVTSAPVWSPDGTQILFGARGGSLYSVDVGSGERSLFVRLPGENLDSMDEIAFSPDGAHLAILNDLEPGGLRLYVIDADGSNLRVLVNDLGTGTVAWSPDGTRLVYPSFSGSGFDLWTVSLDGSVPSLVVSQTNLRCCIDSGSPVWSPDGSQIAFEADRSHFVINANGTDARRIDELTYLSWGDGSYFCGCYG